MHFGKPRAARRYFVTAERFDAQEALRLGLVHEVVPHDELDMAGGRVLAALMEGGPEAQGAAKRLVRDVSAGPVDDVLIDETAKRIAKVRTGYEAKEGISAFLEKRKPNWIRED